MHPQIIPGVVNNQTIKSLKAENTANEAAQMMLDSHVSAVVVTDDDGNLKGIVTERDMVHRVIVTNTKSADLKLGEIMTKDPLTISPDDLAKDALELMRERRFRHLPVTENGKVVGMVSIRDLYDAAKAELEENVRETEAFVFGNRYGA
jgi:signal-transduction protein with cAMP-binding, CBS, and nucleotidyltransferase domain